MKSCEYLLKTFRAFRPNKQCLNLAVIVTIKIMGYIVHHIKHISFDYKWSKGNQHL